MCPEFCIVHCSVDYSGVPRPLLERATRIRVGAILQLALTGQHSVRIMQYVYIIYIILFDLTVFYLCLSLMKKADITVLTSCFSLC